MTGKSVVEDYLSNFELKEENKNLTLFSETSKTTIVKTLKLNDLEIKQFINEFWTAKQRQASSIHEISYRACFKPQLPRFFIKLLSEEGDLVYDPFSGRGTTIIEAGLLGRRIVSNDINPLSRILSSPRLAVPSLLEIKERLAQIPITKGNKSDVGLSMFFHPATEAEIVSLKNYLIKARAEKIEDGVDQWIRMVATNRLTGHSKGFFSVYTLPPNQAASPARQVKINKNRNQEPDYRDTKQIIYKKSASLVRKLPFLELCNLKKASQTALFLEKDARHTSEIPPDSVQLTVTSPPFLDIVQYTQDNWLRCWFNNIDVNKMESKITMSKTVEQWSSVIKDVFKEFFRITKKGGWVAFEVGEVKRGKVKLDEYVIPLGLNAGFKCMGVIVNLQEFTKTSNIWGVSNNNAGTNTNRVVLFHKE